MCGIVAYLGKREAYPILINGLKRLEYRGYDSAGVALSEEAKINLYKCKGSVDTLDAFCADKEKKAHIGIAHTRWATHGEPNDINAHPHVTTDGKLAIVHNGIIENYITLKNELTERGHQFQSDTDTEVLLVLIRHILQKENITLLQAVQRALKLVVGTYGIAVISEEFPEQIVVAKKGSPLLIGLGEDEFFIGSDGAPIVEYTKQVI